MSGGRPSGPQTAVGDHPSCTRTDQREGRGRMGRPLAAPAAHAEGLVLTEDGAAGPLNKKKKRQPAGAGLRKRARDGSRLAETATGGLGSRQPGPSGCALIECNRLAPSPEFVHDHVDEETRAADRPVLFDDDCQLLAGALWRARRRQGRGTTGCSWCRNLESSLRQFL